MLVETNEKLLKSTEYNEIVQTVSDPLYRYALKLTNNVASAKDLVQESFLKLWMNREKVETSYAKPFLFRVLFNKMVDDKRKMKRVQTMEILPEKVVDGKIYNEEKEIIEQAFQQLDENKKRIILLRDWSGFSYEEIAEILEINLSQVKVNLFRARKKMKSIVTKIDSSYNRNQR